jgi:hypothetical protein
MSLEKKVERRRREMVHRTLFLHADEMRNTKKSFGRDFSFFYSSSIKVHHYELSANSEVEWRKK